MKTSINLLLVFSIFALLSLGCSKPADTRSSTTSKPVHSEQPEHVYAWTLTQEYEENELAADDRYKDRLLKVSGKVSNIADTLGNITVQLEGHKALVTVMCSFDESQKAAVSKLRTGKEAILIGRGDGMTGGLYVGLRDCKVQ
jgi:hypothetical protein